MNILQNRRVVLGLGIWFAFAALAGALYLPPTRETPPRPVAVAPADTTALTTTTTITVAAEALTGTTEVAAAPVVTTAVTTDPVLTTTAVTTDSTATTVVEPRQTAATTDTATTTVTATATTLTDTVSTAPIAADPVLTETATTESTATTNAAPANATDTASPPVTAASDPTLVAVGENVFQKTAGGVGCQICHGQDAKGLIGPNIVGKTADDIRYQFANNDRMKFITLTEQEIAAVEFYLHYLADPAAFALPGAGASGDATTAAAAPPSLADPVLANGEEIYQKTAGGVGCQLCHGPDATGLVGPNIVGKTADEIRFQFENNDQMKFIVLNNQEIEAVATYLQYLADPNAAALTTDGAAAAGPAAPAIDDPAVAAGEQVFQVTAGGVGCQLCHGQDAKGLIGPNIVGKTADDIRFQFENNDQMKFITLTDAEIESVATYLQYLATK